MNPIEPQSTVPKGLLLFTGRTLDGILLDGSFNDKLPEAWVEAKVLASYAGLAYYMARSGYDWARYELNLLIGKP